jgi:tungstate transport system ATP-binding protein
VAEAILEIHDLIVRYGESAVVDVPILKVREQEALAIMGPNGAGKSTLLRTLAFLEAPAEGAVIFQGEPVSFRFRELHALHRRIAVIFQEPLLLDGTVFQNVALGLRLRGMKEETWKVGQWLERFGIAHLSDRPAKSLSGGEAQRASLARAFVLSPELLLLDEPFSALDPPTRDALLADFKGILAETKTTTVFVTHDRDEALALGDRVAVMMNGRILQIDIPEQIFSSPAKEEIARFVGAENVFSARVLSSGNGLVAAEIDGMNVAVAGEAVPGDQVMICIRPEDISLSKAEADNSSTENCFQARVVRTIPFGFSLRVFLDGEKPFVALITKRASERLGLREGQSVIASFKPDAAHLIRG